MSGPRRVILRGGEWDGYEIPASFREFHPMLTLQPKGVSEVMKPGIDYYRTDEWDGDRRVYQFPEEPGAEYAGLSGQVFRPEVDARCSCGFVPDPCDRHQSLSQLERDAAQALYDDDDIEVGHEGIGGFTAGQAEETIAVLRRAGFRVVREGVTGESR